MTRRSPFARLAVWAFAFALLLKAAVPMLASASAALQGKALAEVCDVYGVATVALPGAASAGGHGAHGAHAAALDPHAHHRHHGADLVAGSRPSPDPSPHGSRAGDHCVLTALLALSAPQALPVALPVSTSIDASFVPASGDALVAAPDALARWASRLRHGPPLLLA